MRASILILILGFQFCAAQTTRFIYELRMKPDTTNREQIVTENVVLDITGQHSIFYSEKRFQRDSVMTKMRETKNFNFDRSSMENYRTKVNYVVSKDYPQALVTFKNRLGADEYLYKEAQPMTWEVLPETSKIGEYAVQKAKTQYGGRLWYAWFTMDIPLPDGPYKFYGLPGLIVKVEDDKGDYSFDLKESKKVEAPAVFSSRRPAIEIEKKDYLKQEQRYKENPLSFINNSGRARIQINDGAARKKVEETFKENMKKENNPIEL